MITVIDTAGTRCNLAKISQLLCALLLKHPPCARYHPVRLADGCGECQLAPVGDDFFEEMKNKMLKPLGDRIVVKALEAETTTSGGIVLPDTAKERPQTGEVLAVGPGKTLDNGTVSALEVKVGDKVVYSKYGGTEIKVGGEEYMILRQDDVLGIVEA